MMHDYIQFAHHLADISGDVIRPYFNNAGEVESKGDNSPVTLADKRAEEAMRAQIELHYPDHGIYGEEHGQSGLDKKYIWVIDPIDGTRAFIAGHKEWGTLIALCENGIPILGILNQPITGERWVGAQGQPTLFFRHCERSEAIQPSSEAGLLRFARNDGVEIKTRACLTLSAASISTTSKNYFTPEQATRYANIAQRCARQHENGDCYAYGMLARGERDMVLDAGLKPYDILALVPIIEGAGGVVMGYNGPVTLSNHSTACALGDATLLTQL